jgi:two-component system response regulator FlrC
MMTPSVHSDFPVILVEDDDDLREAIAVTLRLNHIDFVTHQRAPRYSLLPDS